MRKKEQDQGKSTVAAQKQPAKRNISTRRQGKLDKTSGKRRELLLHCTSTIDTKSSPLFLPRKIKKTRRKNQQQAPPPSVTPPSSCLSPQLAPLAPRTIEDDKNHDLPRREATTSPAYYTNTNSTNRSPPHVVSVPTENKNDAPVPPPSPKDQERGGSIPQYVSFASNNVVSAALLCRQRSSSSSRRLSVTLSLSSLDDIDIECDIPSPVTSSWNDDRDKVTEFLCGKTRIMLDDSGVEKNAHGKEHQHTATPHGSPLRRRIPDTITCAKQEEQAHDEQQDVETATDTSTRKRRRRNSTPSFASSHEAAPEEAQRRRSAKAFQNFLFPESRCTPSCSHDAALLVHPRRRSTKTFQHFFFPESSC